MIVPVSELRARFETADRPNQKDFVDLIDTLLTQAAGTVVPEMLAPGGARTMLINNPSNQTLWAALSLATLKSSFVAVATNSGNNYTIDVLPAPAAHADLDGVPLLVRIPANNTGAAQFRAHSSLALADLVSNTGGALDADDLTANQVVLLTYNSAISKYQIIGVLGTASSTPPSGSAGGVLTGTYPNPGLADGAVSTTAKLADAIVTKGKIKLISGATEAAGKVLGLVTGGGGLELSWVEQTGGGGGGSGGATNYFTMLTTPAVLDSVSSATVPASPSYTTKDVSANVPVGASFALLEISLNGWDTSLTAYGRVNTSGPDLVLAQYSSGNSSAGQQGLIVQALVPLNSDRTFQYKVAGVGSATTSANVGWSIKLIGYYSPGIAAAGTQTTVFLSTQVQLAANLAVGESTFDLRTAGYVPASATSAILMIVVDGTGGRDLIESRPTIGSGAWLTAQSTRGDYGYNDYGDSTQVTLPLSATGQIELKRTVVTAPGATVKVLLQGYLLPGTTAATIQSGTGVIPSGKGLVNATVITHGLGFTPPHVRVVLRAKNTNNGFTAGDEVDIGKAAQDSSQSAYGLYTLVSENTVRVFWQGDGGSILMVNGAAGGSQFALTNTDWELKAYWTRVDGVIPGNLSGAVLQVVQTVYSASMLIYSSAPWSSVLGVGWGWAAVPNLVAGINLKRTNSKVRVQAVVYVGGLLQGTYGAALRLVRTVGGVDTIIGINTDSTSSIEHATAVNHDRGGSDGVFPVVVDFLDTPGAASCSYRFDILCKDGGGGSGFAYINKAETEVTNFYTASRAVSTITVSEIAA